jgi:DNA-binding GntR family transcriptional regulator
MLKASEKAYEYIRERILSGDSHPAQHLIETQLAEEIGVSRNSVKKALQQLEKDRLVVIERNKGAKVSSLDLNHILQYYEVRIALEIIIMKAAVQNITENDIQKLEEI